MSYIITIPHRAGKKCQKKSQLSFPPSSLAWTEISRLCWRTYRCWMAENFCKLPEICPLGSQGKLHRGMSCQKCSTKNTTQEVSWAKLLFLGVADHLVLQEPDVGGAVCLTEVLSKHTEIERQTHSSYNVSPVTFTDRPSLLAGKKKKITGLRSNFAEQAKRENLEQSQYI